MENEAAYFTGTTDLKLNSSDKDLQKAIQNLSVTSTPPGGGGERN
jgi:hypothetical protein